MEDDKIKNLIMKVLSDTKAEHQADDIEIECLAALASLVVHSDKSIRVAFLTTNMELAYKIKENITKQAAAILKKISNKVKDSGKKDPIVN